MNNAEMVQQMFKDMGAVDEAAHKVWVLDPESRTIQLKPKATTEKKDLLRITPQDLIVS